MGLDDEFDHNFLQGRRPFSNIHARPIACKSITITCLLPKKAKIGIDSRFTLLDLISHFFPLILSFFFIGDVAVVLPVDPGVASFLFVPVFTGVDFAIGVDLIMLVLMLIFLGFASSSESVESSDDESSLESDVMASFFD